MSLLFIAAILSPVATSVPPLRIDRGLDRAVLVRALSAPETPEAHRRGVRLCAHDTLSRPGEVRRVCRTRSDWRRLGVDPITA